MSVLNPFHLALPVHDLDAAADFYCGALGCGTGRTAERWIDLDFFGHQVSLHLVEDHDGGAATNPVDGDAVPARHFGVVLHMGDWQALAERLQTAGTDFLIEPKVRFEGEVGEQATMFLRDPSGNALEFKSFKDPALLFAS
ncbi:MAG: VOC family protein [Woeseiaceae bacterium]|nr:VOC family protein [Woeseiaceae bacterium]